MYLNKNVSLNVWFIIFTFSYRESIVIVKKFELEILTNLHVLDLPESEKHNFGIMSVCEHDNSKTIIATKLKFGMWFLYMICKILSNFEQNPPTGSMSVFPRSCELNNWNS
ncbi:unnamed protein product [Larinioides sclopetarius]|uniref:Uncharacterized protein n=1 Tax=Larinioides sclopetarius TaxID=280406 RepID=A0AAV1Z5E3_9ARAC